MPDTARPEHFDEVQRKQHKEEERTGMVHELRRHEQDEGRQQPKQCRKPANHFTIQLFPQLIEQNEGRRSQQGINDPGRSEKHSEHQQHGMARRILRVPLPVVDHMREIKELLQQRRGRCEASLRKDHSVKHLSNAILNVRDMLECERGDKIRERKLDEEHDREKVPDL